MIESGFFTDFGLIQLAHIVRQEGKCFLHWARMFGTVNTKESIIAARSSLVDQNQGNINNLSRNRLKRTRSQPRDCFPLNLIQELLSELSV